MGKKAVSHIQHQKAFRRRTYFIPAALLIVASLAALVFRVFFPYHRTIAGALLFMVLIILSIPAFSLFRKVIYHRVAWFLIIISSIVILYIMLVLFPIRATVQPDAFLASQIDEQAALLGPFLVALKEDPFMSSPQLSMSLANSTEKDIRILKEGFAIYLDRMLILENIIQEYEGFYKISRHAHQELHDRAFLIGYSAYLARYEAVLHLQETVHSNDYVRGLLDENIPPFGRGNYRSLTSGLYLPETAIKINAGRAYLERIGDAGPLADYASSGYTSRFGAFKRSIVHGAKSLLVSFEQGAMAGWLPVQEELAERLALTRTTSRDGYLIDPDQAESLRETLLPGDILLTRRNWHMSNAGMPGFWTHSAIYTGSLDELDEYFREESFRRFNASFSDVLRMKSPEAYYEKIADPSLSTIEGKSPGIVMYPLAVSAEADHLAAIRPRITESEKLDALLFAFSKYGTPYDYNFDFATEDTYVCSELIYKSYRRSLNFTLEMTAGRWMLAPNDMVRQADLEDPGVDFVLFLDGDESRSLVEAKGEEEFLSSWKRPKHDLILRYG